ncbi:MAG: hydrogenase maturation protease, partial [bacterium]
FCVLGLGNLQRRDDGVGCLTVRAFAQKIGDMDIIISESDDPAALWYIERDVAFLVIVDAVFSGAEPGAIFRLDATKDALPREYFPTVSTHVLQLADAIEIARVLMRLPEKVIVYGIEGADYSFGDGLTPEVERASDDVVGRLLHELTMK